jgi:hypothetical protein
VIAAIGQQSFWNDHDDKFQRALRGGNLASIVSVAGRRVLEATGQPEYDDAIALLRDVLPDPAPNFDPLPFIESNEWTYAKTRPESPHFYVLLRNSSDWRTHLKFLTWIRKYGEARRWRDGRIYRTVWVGEFHYWALGPNDSILNRARQW